MPRLREMALGIVGAIVYYAWWIPMFIFACFSELIGWVRRGFKPYRGKARINGEDI